MRAFDPSTEMAAVRREVAALPTALANRIAVRGWPVASVILDGSWVRGDFWPGAGDVDLTVTFAGAAPAATEDLAALRAWLEERAERVFPPRPAGRKPLRFDVQGQTLDEVAATANRPLADWSADAVPAGYPKLWLYAFDGIRHHAVLFGEDVTERYTRQPPKVFVPIRLERLSRAVAALGDEVSDYDRTHGTISQMKNAWEILRAIHLARGGDSIAKNDLLAAAPTWNIPGDSWRAGLRIMEAFYRNGVIPELGGEAGLRRALHRLAREMLEISEKM